MKPRTLVLFFALLLLAPAFLALGSSIQVAIPSDVAETLDPHRATGALTFEILYNIYQALVEVAPDGMLRPGLAHRWDISDDGLHYTFFLKPGVFFHNGEPFDAADVQYSFSRILDPDTGFSKTTNYRAIASIEIVDPLTVTFHLSKPFAPFLALVSEIYIVPDGTSSEQLDRACIGTGPFFLQEWKRDQYFHLVKFESYHEEGLPLLDEAYFRVIPDENAQLLALRSGDIDVFPRMDPSLVYALQSARGIKVQRAPMNLVQVLAFNNEKPPLDDMRVRQAIQYAIDRELLVLLVAEGYARPLTAHLPPESPYYVDFADRYPYDPARARTLLAQAGYPNGLDITIALPQPYPFHQRTGEVIAQMLSEVGIRAKLQIVEWGKWVSDVYRGREYQITIIGHEGEADPYLLLDRFYSDASRNYMNVKIPELDELLDQSVLVTAFEKRSKLIAGILELLVENACAFWTMEPEELVGLNNRVQNWTIYPVYVDALKEVWVSE
ncbi:MAG TPA: ABC transporter substrate-binding protein [Thermotogota bacterium]|nr:ABC transporter substrate-binding protein [Thermotogota bacterium]